MKKTSLFDVRSIVGALLSLYGLILLLNANLWMGLLLLVVGVLMIVWAVTRPIVVDEEQIEADKRAVEEAAGRRTDDEGGAGGVG
jgi:membrane protein required for beta-lactamase induction